MGTLLVDGSYLLHRVLHVPQMRMLSNKDGKPTGGVFGYLKSLRATLVQFPEITRVVSVFDGGHSSRRTALYPEYKHRPSHDEVDPDGISYIDKYRMQVKLLEYLLPRLGVHCLRPAGREADDVIGLLSREIRDNLILVSSDDNDMLQLVSRNVHIWRPMAEERVSLDTFEVHAGIKLAHWLLRKSIVGDGSDNIPGVRGVGPKTITEWLQLCPDIGEYPFDIFFSHLSAIGTKRAKAVVAQAATVLRNYELVDISREVFSLDARRDILDAAVSPLHLDVLAARRMLLTMDCSSLIDEFSQWVVRFQLLR